MAEHARPGPDGRYGMRFEQGQRRDSVFSSLPPTPDLAPLPPKATARPGDPFSSLPQTPDLSPLSSPSPASAVRRDTERVYTRRDVLKYLGAGAALVALGTAFMEPPALASKYPDRKIGPRPKPEDAPTPIEKREAREILTDLEKPVREQLSFKESELFLDPEILYPGSILGTADILRRMETLTYEYGAELGEPEVAQKYTNTLRLLASAKGAFPQAVKFKVQRGFLGTVCLSPLDYRENELVRQQLEANLIVVGGELESVAAAMEAAKAGQRVILCHAGPLGGLSSDEGGNMRYFDAMGVAPTRTQQEIMHHALGMAPGNEISIPTGVHSNLLKYLKKHYGELIEIVQVSTLNSLIVQRDDRGFRVKAEGGIQLSAPNLMDTSPECTIGEKLELPLTSNTLGMGYGLVFDLEGISSADYRQLADKEALHPDALLAAANISRERVLSDSILSEKYRAAKAPDPGTAHTPDYSWGYQKLGVALDFWLHLMAVQPPPDLVAHQETIRQLNAIREMSGFNVAHHPNEQSASFNSLSYHYKKSVRQGDHNLQEDEEFRALLEVEQPLVERFFQAVLGKPVHMRIPNEFYVRQQTLGVQTSWPYTIEEANAAPVGIDARYELDARTLSPRHAWDKAVNTFYQFKQQNSLTGKVWWRTMPAATRTTIPGLFLVNKAAYPPELMPGLRILQHQISLAVDTVQTIIKNTPDAPYPAAPAPVNRSILGRYVDARSAPRQITETLAATPILPATAATE